MTLVYMAEPAMSTVDPIRETRSPTLPIARMGRIRGGRSPPYLVMSTVDPIREIRSPTLAARG